MVRIQSSPQECDGVCDEANQMAMQSGIEFVPVRTKAFMTRTPEIDVDHQSDEEQSR